MILDLRIPKSAQYQGRVLDTAVRKVPRRELTRDQTMQQIEQGWEKITDEEERDKQKEAYAVQPEHPALAHGRGQAGSRSQRPRGRRGPGAEQVAGLAGASFAVRPRSSGRRCWPSCSCPSTRCWSRCSTPVAPAAGARGGFEFRFVGLDNYHELVAGDERSNFLGVMGSLGPVGWMVLAAGVGLLGQPRPCLAGRRLGRRDGLPPARRPGRHRRHLGGRADPAGRRRTARHGRGDAGLRASSGSRSSSCSGSGSPTCSSRDCPGSACSGSSSSCR